MKRLMGVWTGVAAQAVIAMLMLGCAVGTPRGVPESSAAVRGKQIYRQYCAACHAMWGTGDPVRALPALAGQRQVYLRRQIERFASGDRRNSSMHWAFEQVSMTSPQAVNDVVSYISQMPAPQFGDANHRFEDEGQLIYVSRCLGCHGAQARGNPEGTTPSLRAQNDFYLYRRLARFALIPTLDIEAHRLDEHDITAVSSYLSSLKGLTDAHGSAAESAGPQVR